MYSGEDLDFFSISGCKAKTCNSDIGHGLQVFVFLIEWLLLIAL